MKTLLAIIDILAGAAVPASIAGVAVWLARTNKPCEAALVAMMAIVVLGAILKETRT